MIQSVFLLEDDIDDQKLFAEALRTISAQLHFAAASNGVEALKCLNSTLIKPDIIFSDINMPLMNGFEFIKEISTIEAYKNVPIVLLSTFNTSHHPDIKNFKHIPIYTKPSQFKELCRIIEDALIRVENFNA